MAMDTAGLALRLKAEALPMRSRAAPANMVATDLVMLMCICGWLGYQWEEA